jgi:Concanavalin A-like lectin/glucanases superfamily
MPQLIKPANNLTISAWYLATRVDDNDSSSEVISGGNSYLLRVQTSGLRFSKRIPGTSVQCNALLAGHLDGAWHHIAAVSTPAGMKVYFDGAEKCTNTRGEDIRYDQSNDLWIGRHGNNSANYDFDGNIDDVRIYNRELSAPEIANLARGGL